MSRVVFVRHGETMSNAAGRVVGHRDDDLTATGAAQARALAAPLSRLGFDRRISSDLRRAVHTAELAWPHDVPGLETAPALRERHVGAFEGLARRALRADGRSARLVAWADRPPGGESYRDLARRVLGWLQNHDDGSRMLVVTHAGVIRCLVGLLDGVPRDQIGTIRIPNAHVERRDVEPDRWDTLAASVTGNR